MIPEIVVKRPISVNLYSVMHTLIEMLNQKINWLMAPVLCVIIVSACRPAADATGGLQLESCQLDSGVNGQCGVLTVPENRVVDNGRSIDLNIAVMPAISSLAEPDPLFMLAGGPGQAATETYPLVVGLLDDLNETRDIVLVDQRGTGESNPLTCTALEEVDEDADLSDTEVVELLHTCAAQLQETADLTQYTTEIAVQDLEEVRQALGYGQINLYGASYGTRAAMTYARRYPENVRTLILDAVVGPELILFQQMPRDGQRSLELLFTRCAQDDACNKEFPNLEQELTALLADLETPVEITLEHPLSGKLITQTIDRDRLSRYIYNILYSTDLTALLPLLIHNAAESGDYTPLIMQGLMVADSSALNLGLLYAVTCAEDAPLIEMAVAEDLQAGSEFDLRADDFAAICEAWPETAVADDFRAPLTVDIPTLLLSGEADPVTPPNYAETVAADLPNSLHLAAPDYGHGLLLVGCVPDILTRFVAAGSVQDIDITCLEKLQPPPFFVNLTGPEP